MNKIRIIVVLTLTVAFLSLLAAGVFATIGQMFLTYAYHQAPATRISIYNYAHVVFAFLSSSESLRIA